MTNKSYDYNGLHNKQCHNRTAKTRRMKERRDEDFLLFCSSGYLPTIDIKIAKVVEDLAQSEYSEKISANFCIEQVKYILTKLCNQRFLSSVKIAFFWNKGPKSGTKNSLMMICNNGSDYGVVKGRCTPVRTMKVQCDLVEYSLFGVKPSF